jgi:hypothetical protein
MVGGALAFHGGWTEQCVAAQWAADCRCPEPHCEGGAVHWDCSGERVLHLAKGDAAPVVE